MTWRSSRADLREMTSEAQRMPTASASRRGLPRLAPTVKIPPCHRELSSNGFIIPLGLAAQVSMMEQAASAGDSSYHCGIRLLGTKQSTLAANAPRAV